MFVPPTLPAPTPTTPVVAPQQVMKQPRGGEQVRTQTRTAVDATERQEQSYRARPRNEFVGRRLDLFV